MSLVILDGMRGDDPIGRYLAALAEARQMPVKRFSLAAMKMAPCLGDFECWTKTPGRCRTQDGAQEIARAMHEARLVVFLSPVTFGGYSADLKKGVDRLIGLVHPYFHDRDGLTRHMPRYDRYAPMLFVGVSDRPYSEAAETFHELAMGNAINLIAPGHATCVISPHDPDWAKQLDDAMSAVLGGRYGVADVVHERGILEQVCSAEQSVPLPDRPLRSAAILIGSARPKGTSTSELLAKRIIAELERAGVETRVIYSSSFIKPGRAAEQALAEMLDSELLLVAAPLYVDGLPYLVVSALEQIVTRLQQQTHVLERIAGILNCGYPEAIHNRIAMRMLRNFAHQGQLSWMGGLPLGGGEVLQGKLRHLASVVAHRAMRGLSIAGASLAAGGMVPAEAIRLVAKPLVPSFMFRWVARLRWILMARPNGVSRKQLSDRPWAGDIQPVNVTSPHNP